MSEPQKNPASVAAPPANLEQELDLAPGISERKLDEAQKPEAVEPAKDENTPEDKRMAGYFRYFKALIASALKAATSSEPSKDEHSEEETFSRRKFLVSSAKTVGAGVAAVAGAKIAASIPLPSFSTSKSSEHKTTPEAAEIMESPFEKVNFETARKIAYVFAGIIGGAGAGKISLDQWTSAIMGTLEWDRLSQLEKVASTPEEKQEIEKERHEIQDNLKEVFFKLLPLAEISSHLRVNDEALNQFAAQTLGSIAQERNSEISGTTEKPSMSSPLANWEKHLNDTSDALVKKLGVVGGICVAAAPLMTTYTSSSLFEGLKGDILRLFYDKSFAEKILEKRKAGLTVLEEEVKALRAEAIEEANALQNGFFGFDKLGMFTSCNGNGALGVGDPPELIFMAKYPHLVAESWAMGILGSELMNYVLYRSFLSRLGLAGKADGFLKEFTASQAKTAAAIAEGIYQPLMATKTGNASSLNVVSGYSTTVADILASEKSDEEKTTALAEAVGSMQKAKLQINLPEVWEKKKAALHGITDTISALWSGSKEHDEQISESYSALQAALGGETVDSKVVVKSLRSLQRGIHTQEGADAKRLAELFETMIDEKSLQEVEKARSAQETPSAPEAATASTPISPGVLEEIQATVRQYRQQSGDTNAVKMADLAKKIQLSGKTPSIEKLREQLGKDDVELLSQAFQQMGGLENNDPHAKKPSLLSPSAKEVVFALLTQIPAVPSLVVYANSWIKDGAEVKAGEKPSEKQLKGMLTNTLFVEFATAAISSVADNVAAMIFGIESMETMFKNAYGPKILEEVPRLRKWIAIACKVIAEAAGAVTKLGNGPNMTQKVHSLIQNPENAEDIQVEIKDLSFKSSMWNGYSYLGVTSLIGIFGTIFNDVIESDLRDWQAQQVGK